MASAPELQELPVPHGELAKYIADHPEKSVVEIMKPYRDYEAQLRSIFAQDRQNPLLKDPHCNLLPIFNENTKQIKTRARDLASESPEEKTRYIMALPEEHRRANGTPAVVQSLAEFRKNFGIFSESSLADMDWNNVVAAGSSVINTLLPVPDAYNKTKRTLREYYHEKFCPASDVDLFLYGLTHDEAIEKIKQIERAVRDSILSEVTVVRTKYAITIASQYPTRHVQIVLRVYKSVGEILTGFDIDAAGGAYDGSQVWVTPRALGSFITQINHIDLTRRSPSYENRLSKYSHRGFEVYWPELDRNRVDPTIFERSFQRTLGLARLLVLERLPTSSIRDTYLNKRREERGRPAVHRSRQILFGNIKDNHEDEVADWVDEQEVSNYHTFSVPYGEKFHAKKIEKLCYTRDLLLNAEWNQPKEREVYLHRHPAFFGRVEDVIEDCCGSCPEPATAEEIEVAEKEREIYISGKVTFMIDDPGRQQIGSFNPLTENDWTDMAYVGNTARLCQSIVDGSLDEVLDWLSQEGADPNCRDYTGRAPLHLAVMSSTPEVVRALVDHGARLTARLADGYTALHLAAERGNVEMVKILMERSVANEAEFEEKEDARRKALREALKEKRRAEGGMDVDSDDKAVKDSQNKGDNDEMDVDTDEEDGEDSDGELIDAESSAADSHSIVTGSFVKVKKGEKGETEQGDLEQEDAKDEPDYYKSDVIAWDIPCSPLHLAITEGHEEVVEQLCNFGSDALLPVKFLDSDRQPTAAILTLALALRLPLEQAKSMAALLLRLGASSAQADLNGCTALHRYVQVADPELFDTLLENDKSGVKTAVNHLISTSKYEWRGKVIPPLYTAIQERDTIMVMKLLAAGANPQIDFETWLKSAKHSSMQKQLRDYEHNKKMYAESVEQPLISAIETCWDSEVAEALLDNGADPNALTSKGEEILANEYSRNNYLGETALDLVRWQIEKLRKYEGETFDERKPVLQTGMEQYLENIPKGTYRHWIIANDVKYQLRSHKSSMKEYQKKLKRFEEEKEAHAVKKEAINAVIAGLQKLEHSLLDKGGKTFYELHPEIKRPEHPYNHRDRSRNNRRNEEEEKPYTFEIRVENVKDVTEVRKAAYYELFEAAWIGDLDKIKELTTQAWGEKKSQAPLKIAVTDSQSSSPFSLAWFRGHQDVARAILDIVKIQYSPPEKEDESRYTYEMNGDNDNDYNSDESDDDSDAASGDNASADGPKIVSKKVNAKFTIENIGEVSMHVKSHDKPLTTLLATYRCFDGDGKTQGQNTPLSYAITHDNEADFKKLMDMAIHFSGENLPGDDGEDSERYFTFPESDFQWAVSRGKIPMLTEIIRLTGGGMPLDHLVKKSGVEMKEKPKYYQGLTVYGKKRNDWATAGRNLVVKSTKLRIPPLLEAALNGSIASVEWFLSDAPHRLYVEFSQSTATENDPRLKHLRNAPGGFDRTVSKWLGIQNELVLHCAVMATPTEEALKLVKYLVQACPNSLEYRSTAGDSPLWLAFFFGRVEYAQVLLKAGANPTVRNKGGYNILHAALWQCPKAKVLRPMLEVLEPDLRRQLFLQRCHLQEHGMTPFHSWAKSWTSQLYHRNNRYVLPANKYTGYKTREEAMEVFNLILEMSGGAELEMLNAAGETPLHHAVMEDNSELLEALIDHNPNLMYRENAVGRTPTELAHSRVTKAKFAEPNRIYFDAHNREGACNLRGQGANSFLDAKKEGRTLPDRPRRHHVPNITGENVWITLLNHMAEHPGKRRLVSLNEANDVAKRISDKYDSARYFSMKPKKDFEEEEDQEDKEDEQLDYAAQNRNRSGAWEPVEKDIKIERPDDSSDDDESVPGRRRCGGCGDYHD